MRTHRDGGIDTEAERSSEISPILSDDPHSKTVISMLTCGVSVKWRHLALRFLQFSLQPDVHMIHQMREQRQSKSNGCTVLLRS